MPLTPEQKKLLVGGGVGALALVVGYAIFGGRKAAAAPVTSVPVPQHIPPPQRVPTRHIPPPQRVPTRDLKRRRKKRRRDDDDDNERGERGENGRGEYGRMKHRGHHRGY